MTEHELSATVIDMRAARKSWQTIATATHRHPGTVRALGVSLGLPVCLPGFKPNCGGWARHRELLANPPPGVPYVGNARVALPAGSPETWGAISGHPWPGYQVAA